MEVPELPMDPEMWTVHFEGDPFDSFDFYIDPEWHNGVEKLCATIRFVNAGQVVSYHEINPTSLRDAMRNAADYLDEMIEKREEAE